MSGYTRQSAADIVPTAVVKAAPLNTEYNKIRDAFTFDITGSTGHRHDGTSDEGSYVPLIADLEGLNKFVIDTSNNRISAYVEVSAAAVEQLRIEDGVVYPVTTNDIDLGTGSLQFKDAYFDGTVRTDTLLVDENATVTANLTVNGNTTLGNAATDTVTITADVASNIIPSADSTYTLGDASNYWSHGYIDAVTTTGNVTIGGNISVTGTADFTNTTLDNVTDPSTAQQAATKNYVDTQLSALVDAAPGTLDTLNELAAAIGDDPNFATTITNSVATKLPLAGGTMSGDIVMGGNRVNGAALTPITASELTSKSYVDSILGSADDAVASAAAAAISETNAAASYDSFDDRYLGAKASDPSVDNDGDALTNGVLYYNTTSGFMNVYDTADGWKLAGSAVNGTSNRKTYTATGGQTDFSITYDVGYVDTYLNGVKLLAGTDFTATDGSTVVLTTGATAGDIVDMVAYGTFEVADSLTISGNLSDLDNASTARTNLGVAVGSDVQAWGATLDDVAGLSPALSNLIMGDGSNFVLSGAETTAIQTPSGTTAERPAGANGMIRYNSDDGGFEGYAAGEWGSIGGGGNVQTATTTSVTETAIATYVLAEALGSDITIVATDTVATERTITKLLITHDGVTAVATQYGEVNTATAIATFDVDISGGNVRVLATAASTNSTNYTVNATLLA